MRAAEENILSMEGAWKLSLRMPDGGKRDCGMVSLPSTVTEQGFGEINDRKELLFLSEKRRFVGKAEFERTFNLPEIGWNHVIFYMERTRLTSVEVNGRPAGSRDALTTGQRYDITTFVHAGENRIRVVVDNTYEGAPHDAIIGSHMATEHTQTNWNGILGRIEIRILPFYRPSGIRVLPDAKRRTAEVMIDFDGLPAACSFKTAKVKVKISQPGLSGQDVSVFDVCLSDKTESYSTRIQLDPDTPLWSEFTPKMTNIRVITEYEGENVCIDVPFGLRSFDVDEDRRHFCINGLRTFLRSEANCCVFPISGYAPMDEKSWERLLRAYQSYGVNYVRFHSWCPPEAAFACADRLGIYMQPELCEWTFHTFEEDAEYDYYTREAENIAYAYANHPSFVAMTWGNELRSGNRTRMGELCRRMRQYDPTRLYAEGSNAWYGLNGVNPESDFVMAQGNYKDSWRGAFAGNHGFINDEMPGEEHTYSKELEKIPVPAVSFEVGQFQTYPDYSEIDDYTGVLEARNLQSYRDTLAKHGMAGCDGRFQRASGMLAEQCYREEIEAARRTPELAGISLLGLQDFPGQGTALVGMMDAFGRPKKFSDPERFSRFFGAVVPLLSFHKYAYQEGETAEFTALIHNFGPEDITDSVSVSISDETGKILFEKEWKGEVFRQGTVTKAGEFRFHFPPCGNGRPEKRTASIKVGAHIQEYKLFIFPVPEAFSRDEIVKEIDKETLERLSRGEKLLFLPTLSPESVPSGFPMSYISDFWCWIMFSKWDDSGTLGICPDRKSSLWDFFPVSDGTDPGWWTLLHGARAVRITGLGLKPLLMAIDNIQRNEQLSLVMEAKVGKGALLISTLCMDNPEDPAQCAFLKALLQYLHSDQFCPEDSVSAESLVRLFQGRRKEITMAGEVLCVQTDACEEAAAFVLTDDDRSWCTNGNVSPDGGNTMEFTLRSVRKVNTVRIRFLSDTAYASEGDRRVLPDTYEVSCRVNGEWRSAKVLFQSAVSDGGENICYFEPVLCEALRIHFQMHAGAGVDVMSDKDRIRESIAVQRVCIYEAVEM